MNFMDKYQLIFLKDQFEDDLLNELTSREWLFSKV